MGKLQIAIVLFIVGSLFGSPLYSHAQMDTVVSDSIDVTDTLKSTKTLRGIASYYHDKFEGRRMANGRLYSRDKLTAACNVLPLNTWIKVTSILNGRTVIVKVTDRLHKKNTRLVDLSRASARRLNMLSHGLMKVKVEVLKGYKPHVSDK